jgi:hypothetical protein
VIADFADDLADPGRSIVTVLAQQRDETGHRDRSDRIRIGKLENFENSRIREQGPPASSTRPSRVLGFSISRILCATA